jgi:hypothetical protein
MRTITNFQTQSIESEWKEWKAKICPTNLTPDNERGLKIAFLSGATVGARMAVQLASVSGQSILDHVAMSLKTFAQSAAGGGRWLFCTAGRSAGRGSGFAAAQ